MEHHENLKIADKNHSLEKFKKIPVTRDDIEMIVRIGDLSPSGFVSQAFEVLIIDDQELLSEISQKILESEQEISREDILGAPVLLFIYGDKRIRDHCTHPRKNDDNWWEMAFSSSLTNAFIIMRMAAESLGLGSMWIPDILTPEVDDQIRKLLKVPDHLTTFEMMAIGYPEHKNINRRSRGLSDIIHYNFDMDLMIGKGSGRSDNIVNDYNQ